MLKQKWEDNTEMDVGVVCPCEYDNEPLDSVKGGNF